MTSTSDRSTLRLIGSVLQPRDRLRLLGSLVFILVGTLLEMASLGLVIPVVQAVVSGDRRAEYQWMPRTLSEISYGAFVQLLMLALLVVFSLKNFVVLASNYVRQRIAYSIENRIVHGLFQIYLRQPFEFHLIHTSSSLVRNVQEYASAVVGGGITPALTIATDILTGLGLFLVLVAVQPLSTAVMVVFFGISSCLVIAMTRSRSRRWGSARVEHRGAILNALVAGFGGAKEIKLFGRDREVVESHRHSLNLAARSSYLFALVQQVPRAFFEVITVSGVALLVILATLTGQSLQETAVVVALFGVVGFRMLPSVSRIVQSLQLLSFNRAGIEGAVEGLALERYVQTTQSSRPTDRFNSLEVRSLKFRYPNRDEVIADIDSFTITAGESLGIVGSSGSGKSTLVDLLIGILSPVEGSIHVNGRNIADDPRYWQDRIGYVPQHVFLMDTTIRKNVAFGLAEKAIDDRAVTDALRAANLLEFVDSLPDGVNTVVGERGVRLSGGQRQRLGIARALYGNPEVIVLDEATSALDVDTEREIVESLREIAVNHTLIVVAHRTSTLAYCSRLIRLEGGRIVQEGTFAEVVGSLSPTSDRGQ